MCISTHVRVLRLCGFHRRAGGGNGVTSHDAYRVATLTLTVGYAAQELVYAYQNASDMEALVRVMFLLLCHVTSLIKQLVFFIDAEAIDALQRQLDDPLFNQTGADGHHVQRVHATRVTCARVHVVYSGAALATCALWLLLPVAQHVAGAQILFPFWLPDSIAKAPLDDHLTFALVLGYSNYVITLVGLANTSMDAFVAALYEQCTAQLHILCYNLEYLTQSARAAGGNYERTLMTLLVQNLQHYDKITKMTQDIQRIFGTCILVQFLIGGWILCFAAYQIVSLSLVSLQTLSMVLFALCITTELFLYCWCGNQIHVQSGLVLGAVCGGDWLAAPPRVRRALLTVCARAQVSLRPRVLGVLPLNLQTFVKIIKSSYSFYAVLRQTK